MANAKPWWASRTLWGIIVTLVSASLAGTVAPETLEEFLWLVAAIGQAVAWQGRTRAQERIVTGNQGKGLGNGSNPTKPSPPANRAANVLALFLLVGVASCSPAQTHRVVIATGTHAAKAAQCMLKCSCAPADACVDDDTCMVHCAMAHGGGLLGELLQIFRAAGLAGATTVEIQLPPPDKPVSP